LCWLARLAFAEMKANEGERPELTQVGELHAASRLAVS
jgi:hypothetical protein